MKRVAIISSYAQSVISFRSELVVKLISHDILVDVYAPDFTSQTLRALKSLGANAISYPLKRTGTSFLSDIRALIVLYGHFRCAHYDQVFTYFLKPNIWGTLAAFLARVPQRTLMIEGLGYLFTHLPDQKHQFKKLFLKQVVLCLYRIIFLLASKVIVLNPDDLEYLVSHCSLRPTRALLLGGIGVDIDFWRFSSSRPFPPIFIMVARLLREKGVCEYLQAASLVKSKYPDAKFLLLGSIDSNPGSIAIADLFPLMQSGVITYLGHVDVLPHLSLSTVFVLPSYREGVPRSTQEALSVGLPVITTDVPGCRETVIHGVNGFLVPPYDSNALAHAMLSFCSNPNLAQTMGLASRAIAKKSFNIKLVTDRLFSFAFSPLLISDN